MVIVYRNANTFTWKIKNTDTNFIRVVKCRSRQTIRCFFSVCLFVCPLTLCTYCFKKLFHHSFLFISPPLNVCILLMSTPKHNEWKLICDKQHIVEETKRIIEVFFSMTVCCFVIHVTKPASCGFMFSFACYKTSFMWIYV